MRFRSTLIRLSHAFHIRSMAACMNTNRAELEKTLFKLNSWLPAADTVCIALVNGYVRPSVAAAFHELITRRWRRTGPHLSPSLAAHLVSVHCTPR